MRTPWNKGKLIGAKPPLRPSHVWSISTKLQMQGKRRDLALFNLAIDSKLRGCDVVAVRVDDVAPSGYSMDRATIRQKKTGRPVRFELTDQTRLAIDEYLRLTGRKPSQVLFAGRGNGERGLTTRQYASSYRSGLPALVSIRRSLARTPCDARRPCLSIGALATSEPCNSCWGIPRLRALCAISVSRSMTPSKSRKRSTSGAMHP